MRNFVTTTALLATMLLAGASGAAAAQFEFGITIGRPPVVRVQRQPRSPGPGYVWLSGYWYPGNNNRYVWHDGYWTRPPYAGAQWVAPRHDGTQYYSGYWEGDRGRTAHDHQSDRNQQYRDYGNGNNGNGNGNNGNNGRGNNR